MEIRSVVRTQGTMLVILRIRFCDRQADFFVEPPAQINEAAAFATEGHTGVVLQRDLFPANGTG